MQRRTHKKSRNGCLVCKKRHLKASSSPYTRIDDANLGRAKCDESTPSCVNCTVSKLECAYSTRRGRRSNDSTKSSPVISRRAPSPLVLPKREALLSDDDGHDLPYLEMNQLELLHHFTSQTLKSFGRTKYTDTDHDVVIRVGLSNSYLMHEMLSLASLHMASLQPQRRLLLHDQATRLQSCAFRLFNQSTSTSTLTFENCVPIFLFSGLVGLHALHEASITAPDDPEAYLDSFINYLHMFRALNIVLSRYWHFLIESSELSSFLGRSHGLPREPYGLECEGLRHMLSAAELPKEMDEAHSLAIDRLQVIQDVESVMPGSMEASHVSSGWILRLDPIFLESLAQRQPISLLVLSEYGKQLQNHSQEWIVGDSGKYLVQSIEKLLQRQAETATTTPSSYQTMPS